jgi:hypothetical protein
LYGQPATSPCSSSLADSLRRRHAPSTRPRRAATNPAKQHPRPVPAPRTREPGLCGHLRRGAVHAAYLLLARDAAGPCGCLPCSAAPTRRRRLRPHATKPRALPLSPALRPAALAALAGLARRRSRCPYTPSIRRGAPLGLAAPLACWPRAPPLPPARMPSIRGGLARSRGFRSLWPITSAPPRPPAPPQPLAPARSLNPG